jgi:pyruvate/2-oxoglutarate dehydrogenase complex dihydrolipoamide acyltransferase (E2) component
VPILRDVHTIAFSRISRERAGLAKRGAPRCLAPEELTDSVLPFSNSRVLDSLLFTPITKPLQHAPLATGTITEMPVVRRREFVGGSLSITKDRVDQWGKMRNTGPW